MKLSPGARLEFMRRLGSDWSALATILEIADYDQSRFPSGDEARQILRWLEQRGRLDDLDRALRTIDRADLADWLQMADERHPESEQPTSLGEQLHRSDPAPPRTYANPRRRAVAVALVLSLGLLGATFLLAWRPSHGGQPDAQRPPTPTSAPGPIRTSAPGPAASLTPGVKQRSGVPMQSIDAPTTGSGPILGPNLVTNGAFAEDGTAASTTYTGTGNPASGAAGWYVSNGQPGTTTTRHQASDRVPGGKMLSVCTMANSGLFQNFGPAAGNSRVQVTSWLKVTSGQAGIGVGNDGATGVNHEGYVNASGTWTMRRFVYDPTSDSGGPATEIKIYGLGAGQTCFSVDYVAVQVVS